MAARDEKEREVIKLETEIARLRAEAGRKEHDLERIRLELAELKRGDRPAAAGAQDPAVAARERETLLKQSRDTQAAIKRLKDKAAARGREQERRLGDVGRKEAEVKQLESEVGRLRAGAIRGERDLAEMERKLQQARRRPAR